jgi:hypothetical protein
MNLYIDKAPQQRGLQTAEFIASQLAWPGVPIRKGQVEAALKALRDQGKQPGDGK